MQLLTLLFAIATLFSVGNCSCEDPNDSQYCYEILHGLENALTQDKGNLYRSRRAFFYAPNANPVLVRVEYKITFAENITEDVLPNCTNKEKSSVLITLNQTEIIRGWTSTGLYLWIEPMFLNLMQVTFPFFILRVIRPLAITKSNPEMETFLWDGSYDLSPLRINLHITSLPCIPSQELFDSTVEDLTTFVSYQCMQFPIGACRPGQWPGY